MESSVTTTTDSVSQQPQQVPSGRFQFVKGLGRGGQGIVQLALDTANGNSPVAVKYIDRGFSKASKIEGMHGGMWLFCKQLCALMHVASRRPYLP